MKIDRNVSANIKGSKTDYSTDLTTETTTPILPTCGERSNFSLDIKKPRRHKHASMPKSDVIDPKLLERLTARTPFNGLTPDLLAPAIRKFGVEKVLTAVDIAAWRKVKPETTPEQYIFGMCSNGPKKPAGFKPLVEREADAFARHNQKVAEEEAKAKKEAEEAKLFELHEEQAQALYESLPISIRKRADELARSQYPDSPILRQWACRKFGRQMAQESDTADVVSNPSTSNVTLGREERLALLRLQASLIK